MKKKILLTSFSTWLPHHQSNSSDDLLDEVSKCQVDRTLTFLRKLPVDSHKATSFTLEAIENIQPHYVICCGMAETRSVLTVESHATQANNMIKTSVNLENLINGLSKTKISHDAGKFVCESLYYSVLKHLGERHKNKSCIFVHVPLLKPDNKDLILVDFINLIHRL